MNKFHLPPSDPRIKNMTMEQRNYCIANMNEDIAEAQGKSTNATTDTTKDDWLHEPEEDFSPIPKDMDAKKVYRNINRMLGPTHVIAARNLFKSFRKQAILHHKYRVSKGQASERIAIHNLRNKAIKHNKKKGIDKSNEWNKYLGKRQSGQHKGFDV